MLIELALASGSTALWHRLKRKKKPSLALVLKGKHKRDQDVSFDGKRLFFDLKSVLVEDERKHLQMSIDPSLEADQEDQKKRKKRNLILSGGAVGLAILGSTSPVFYILGSLSVLYLGRRLYQNAWKDLKSANYITVYSVNSVLMLSMVAGNQLIYAAITGLISGFIAQIIQRAEDSSQKQLVSVFEGHPQRVWIEKNGIEIQVDFDAIQKNDIVIVQSGEIIPVDGVIQKGSANIDQHILTGESQPVDRGEGETVFAATLVLAGRISILVEMAGEETVAANIGRVLNNTKSYKDHLMLRGKKLADRMLPIELITSVVTLGVLGPIPAMAVLWSGIGYRMIIFGPISVLNYLQILSRRGVLIKDGRVLESLRNVDTVVFDKTGTLTREQPTIGTIHLLADYDEDQVLYFAASAEHHQTHPVAKAIIDKAHKHGITPSAPQGTSYEVGYGIKVELEEKIIRVGSARFIQREDLALPIQMERFQPIADETGHSFIYVSVDSTVIGVLEMQPDIRPEARHLIQKLHNRGIKTCIISGDHEIPTRNMAKQLGIDNYFSETLPENKAELVKQLREEGRFVCFIGDGINDAIALKSAHVSISLKGASSAATDTAQIIFMDGTLVSLNSLFEFTDDFERTMHRNLLISTAPGILNIGGIYLLHFGLATSVSLFYGGTVLGLTNTVLPLVKHQNK